MSNTSAVLKIVAVIAETIRELGRVPSGHLYARLMGEMSLENYNKIIEILKKTGLVKETGAHELIWVGPTTQPAVE